MVLIRPKPAALNSRFLRFWLNSQLMAQHIAGVKDGSVAERLNMPTIRSLPVPTLSLWRQLSIASILGALDDKIELNRKMNETMEAMARAIFRDWFVDFGATRAKIDGLPSYLAPDIWALFPDQMDDEGKPEGWSVGRVSEIIDFGPHEPLKKGVVAPYLDMAAIPTKGPAPAAPILREYGSGTRFRNGDTLLARITPCLENGKTAYVENLPKDAIGWGSTEFIVMRSRPPVPSPVSYLIAREPSFRQAAIQSMTGTSGRQRANADAISEFPVALPSNPKVWTALSEILDPIFAKIRANAVESQTLAATRDLLLPKLMSGEIRVKEAERLAETASPEEIAERLNHGQRRA
jgi:type I restriction enzyme S subunit